MSNQYIATRQSENFIPSEEFISRIKRSYREMIKNNGDCTGDSLLWDKIIGPKKKDIHLALMQEGKEAHELLSNLYKTDLYYGVDNFSKTILVDTPEYSLGWGIALFEMLEQLCEAIGVRAIMNPQGGSRYPGREKPESSSIDNYLELLNEFFNKNLKFHAPFKNQFGLNVEGSNFITDRSIYAAYQAYRLHQLCSTFNYKNCIEIGAGMGITALYAHSLGINYTAVDLPMGLVGISLFLAATLGEANIQMSGENNYKNAVRLMAPKEFYRSEEGWDIAFNCDSFTEMSKDSALGYLSRLKDCAKVTYSINHEANDFTVKDLCQTIEFKNLARNRYWFWQGYVEELYSKSIPNPSNN